MILDGDGLLEYLDDALSQHDVYQALTGVLLQQLEMKLAATAPSGFSLQTNTSSSPLSPSGFSLQTNTLSVHNTSIHSTNLGNKMLLIQASLHGLLSGLRQCIPSRSRQTAAPGAGGECRLSTLLHK